MSMAAKRPGEPKAPRKRLRALARRIYRLGVIALAIICGGLLALEIAARLSPYPAALLGDYPHSQRIYARDGQLLREAVSTAGTRARWIPLEQVHPLLVAAIIETEDTRFFAHGGVDYAAIARAIFQNAAAGRVVSGASTLHMQLSRLLVPHKRRSLWGKLRELFDARRLTHALGQRGVLEQYLNRAPFGPAIVGVEAASRSYFGKPTSELDLEQIALLAGLPKAPSAYDPRRFAGAARARRAQVLDRLRRAGLIDRRTERIVNQRPIVVKRHLPRPRAMHFTEMLLAPQKQRGSKRGSGVTLRSTLDSRLQSILRDVVRDELQALGSRGARQAAVVLVENRDCAVRGLVGSSDYFKKPDGAVNGAIAPRQPGSTLKPFAYAMALQNGRSLASVLADVKTEYGKAPGAIFSPRNFTNHFSGPVLLGDALGRSLNVPAIEVTAHVSLEKYYAQLKELGFASLDQKPQHYGLSLVLGSGEVTLMELAAAYTALARRGEVCKKLRLLRDAPLLQKRVFDPSTSYLLGQALRDPRVRIEAFGPRNALMFDYPVAVKTGTSSDFRDSWTVGYTDRFTLAVWMGRFDGHPTQGLSGANGAGRLFARIFAVLVAQKGQPRAPSAPQNVRHATVCALSGKLPHAGCAHRRTLSFRTTNLPRELCDWHRSLRVDRRNGLLAGKSCPAAFVTTQRGTLLPARFRDWQIEHGHHATPRRYSPLCPKTGAASGSIAITSPRFGEVYVVEPGYDRHTQTVQFSATLPSAPRHLTWYLDGRRLSRVGWPYRASWRLQRGKHTLMAAAPGLQAAHVSFEVR
jgi:penicillin-binding protein 1C